MTYSRVIPRDLFNEAKLLKCLGQLALICHDTSPVGLTIEMDEPEAGFQIVQSDDDGGLECETVAFFVHGKRQRIYTGYNSKMAYPLMCETDEDTIFVLNEDGSLTDEFKSLIG